MGLATIGGVKHVASYALDQVPPLSQKAKRAVRSFRDFMDECRRDRQDAQGL
ncbi:MULTISPECIES: hypothetical protein [unclassified Streptomyces]|uniref:hypothetical protein n=1 Tax=unclassified Streptomyces TaxID=2593676 RepID=UPI0013A6A563|nr:MULTISPECIES: hypothetical protein [unclassified Streptomyces]